MPDATDWITALSNSQQRLTALLQPLTSEQVERTSYADEWSIAQVASHLGSQAEIFSLFLDAGLTGTAPPGNDAFAPIWDRWNALAPLDQVTQSLAGNDAFIARLQQIPPAERESFALSMFGMDLDLRGLTGLRLAEHAVHTWDIAVVFDPSATLSADAAELLVDVIAATANRVGKPLAAGAEMTIQTTQPTRQFRLTIDADHVVLTEDPQPLADASVQLSAEALIRLVYGRLDPDHIPADVIESAALAQLRTMFTGV